MDEAADGAAMDSSAEVKEQLIKAAAKIILSVIVVILVTAYFAWPSSTALAKKLLTKMRRSVVKYKGPAPAAAVQRAFEAAIHAPNHFLNEPWRFRLVGSAGKKKLGQIASKFKEDGDFIYAGCRVQSACITEIDVRRWTWTHPCRPRSDPLQHN